MRTHLISKLAIPTFALALAAGCTPENKDISGEPTALRPASPTTKLVRGRQTKVLVDAADLATRSRLKSATVAEHDYGSFVMLVVDVELAGGRGRLEALPVRIRDDFDSVRLEGRTIDAADPSAVWSTLDASLKNERVLKAFTTGETPAAGLYVVQVVGPMKDEWRAALEGEGLSVVTYVPENAYVVWAKDEAAAALPRLLDKYDFVQLVVDYEPAFKLAPELRALTQSVKLDVVVQVAKTPGFKDTILTLESLASKVRGSADAGEYVNVELTLDSGKIADVAHLDEVFAIERRTERRRLDEAQGQILAGNITGNVPTGPGYLAWHDSKGFTSAQFQSFVVHVVDDSHQLTGT
ncbi:hypothetical protein L6R52_30905, partial [Myxococcota bacterium]|nr:hypothetical protein [Myxococcota bacterium]